MFLSFGWAASDSQVGDSLSWTLSIKFIDTDEDAKATLFSIRCSNEELVFSESFLCLSHFHI